MRKLEAEHRLTNLRKVTNISIRNQYYVRGLSDSKMALPRRYIHVSETE